ncbi:MAG: hypothetical protein OEW58_10005 [Gammaproteobacteria bacterium]|nr:hypothetical protein [Gammaproteobacteria bacterium]
MLNRLKFISIGLLGLNLLLSGMFMLGDAPRAAQSDVQPNVGRIELLEEAMRDPDSLEFVSKKEAPPAPAAPAPTANAHDSAPPAAHPPAVAPAANVHAAAPPVHAAPPAHAPATEAKHAPAKPAPAKPSAPVVAQEQFPVDVPESVCFRVGPLRSQQDTDGLIKDLAEVKLNAVIASKDKGEFLGYWIYLPPERSMALARLKLEELKTKGFTDVFLVLTDEPQRAISLGVYRNKLAAQKRQEEFRSRGYEAELTMRYKRPPEIWLKIESDSQTAPDKDDWKLLLKNYKDVKYEKSGC